MTQVLPDAPACLALLALLLFFARRQALTLLALALLGLLSLEGTARLLDAGLSLGPASANAIADAAAGAIVVFPGDTPDLLDPGALAPGARLPSIDTLASLRVAADLSRRTTLPILVSGARTWTGDPAAADAMAASLRADFGVGVRWEEGVSTNLWQAAAASAALLRPAGIARVYLVAEPWDLRLAATLFQRAGIGIVPAPVLHPPPGSSDWTVLPVYTPAWLDSAIALRQWAALACDAVAACAGRMLKAGPS